MKGYWRNEEATGKVITADGWIDSGDVGHQDEEGNWHVTGREKEMMKIGGENFIVSRLVTLPNRLTNSSSQAVPSAPSPFKKPSSPTPQSPTQASLASTPRPPKTYLQPIL